MEKLKENGSEMEEPKGPIRGSCPILVQIYAFALNHEEECQRGCEIYENVIEKDVRADTWPSILTCLEGFW